MYDLMEKNMLSQFETVRTTITLPVDLIDRSQHFIDGGTELRLPDGTIWKNGPGGKTNKFFNQFGVLHIARHM